MYVGGAAFVNLYFGPERFWMIFNIYIIATAVAPRPHIIHTHVIAVVLKIWQ
jgi:hypothetical protein